MIELSPIVILDGKPQKEEDYKLIKGADGSIELVWKDLRVKIMSSVVIGDKQLVWVNGQRIDRKDYDIQYQTAIGKPGVNIFFKQGRVKVLGLIPRVLTGPDERRYIAEERKKQRSQYQKDHGYLWQ